MPTHNNRNSQRPKDAEQTSNRQEVRPKVHPVDPLRGRDAISGLNHAADPKHPSADGTEKVELLVECEAGDDFGRGAGRVDGADKGGEGEGEDGGCYSESGL